MVKLNENSEIQEYVFANGKELYPYQKRELVFLEKMEQSMYCPVTLEEKVVRTKFGLYTTCEGSGKTRTLLALIQKSHSYENQINSANVYANDVVVIGVKNPDVIYSNYHNVTAIIMPNHLLKHWINECNSLDIKYTLDKIEEATQVILVPMKSLTKFYTKYETCAFRRVVADQAEQLKISTASPLKTTFIWFVSSCPENLIFLSRYRTKWPFFAKYFKSFNLPWVKVNDVTVQTDSKVVDSFKRTLCQVEKNIVECYCPRDVEKQRRLMFNTLIAKEEYEKAYVHLGFDFSGNKNIPLKYKNKADEEDACSICYEQPATFVGMECCGNVFCVKCIVSWLKQNMSCPLCRRKDIKPMMYVKNEICDLLKEVKPKKLYTKLDAVLQIIKDKPDGKFVIFNMWDYTFWDMSEMLWSHGISNKVLKGPVESVLNYHNKGYVQVLLTSEYFKGCGLSIPWVTDVILYSVQDMNAENIETMFISKIISSENVHNISIHALEHISD
jgi:hypothetical protein